MPCGKAKFTANAQHKTAVILVLSKHSQNQLYKNWQERRPYYYSEFHFLVIIRSQGSSNIAGWFTVKYLKTSDLFVVFENRKTILLVQTGCKNYK